MPRYGHRFIKTLRGVLALWALAWPLPPLRADDLSWIGLRFVVNETPEADRGDLQAIETRLADHVATLNRYYRDSQVAMQAKIVAVAFTRMPNDEAVEILEDMRHERQGFAGLFREADRWGADFTVAATRSLTLRGKPGCGRALAVNQTRAAISTSRNALMVYNPVCGAHTLAHELGHLMGLNHGRMVDGCQPGQGHTSALTPYALGHGVGNCDGRPQSGEFGTIMVGGWMKQVLGHDKASLPFFSNPRLRDPRCGVAQRCGDPETGDAARVLNEHAAVYAAHEEADVDTLPFGDPGLRACLDQHGSGVEIAALKQLICPDRNIFDLTGLESLTALDHLDLSGNNPLPCVALLPFQARFRSGALRPPDHCLSSSP
ncbi:MAG: hypothetical protein HQL99_04440 [Magnetococcales bacterium]|nr:hypothetical protein [Magnetococcales bacterium]